ncbi:MAG: glycoside hydrolase family 30 protein [Polyangia bacterium]
MPRIPWSAMIVGLVAVGTVACKGGGNNLAGNVCNQLSTCNSLQGVTVSACTNEVNVSLGKTGQSGRNDLNTCLSLTDCSAYTSCVLSALGEGAADDSGSGGSVTGGGGNSGNSAGSNSAGGNASNSGGSAGGGTPPGGNVGGSAGAGGSSPSGGAGPGSQAGGAAAGSPGAGEGGASAGGVATGAVSTGAGGQGGTTGGSASTPAPELMTSGPNAYWTAGQVTVVTSGTADLNVDKSTTYQSWAGFGGAFNEMGWDALSVLTSDDVANAMSLLFDPQSGAGFVYGRVPMGASDYAMSWYTLDDGAADYAMNNFSISRDQQMLIPYIKAALQVKPDLHLWTSPWVVPSWMMDSNSNMKSDAQTLGAHALYMARFVEEYAKQGITIEAVHPQNEPGYARVHWTQAELITFMKTYLGPTFAQRNLTAQIWCGTMSKDPDDTNIAKATASDADAMKYVKGFGVQWNLQPAVATLAQTATVMQTEHECGNYNFATPYWQQSQYNPNQPPNDHAYGEESWQLIRDWIVSGVNSYNAWNMVLDTIGKSLDGWPQDALLVVDRSAKKLVVTAAYYAFRHYSYYIAVGATRIGVTGNSTAYKGLSNTAFNTLNALAFKNPDGSVIVQLYNMGGSSQTTTVGVGSALSQTLYQFSVPSHGWATLRLP